MQLTLQEVEKRLKRWHTRLTRASNEVAKLEKKRRRLAGPGWVEQVKTLADRPREHTKVRTTSGEVVGVKTDSEIPLPELDAFFALPSLPEKQIAELVKANADDLTIPPMLKRTMEDRTRDQLAARTAAEPAGPVKKANMARLKRLDEKRRGRSRFSASDMPLSGRDAIKAIKDARRKK
jgi:hypothetical protein